MQLTTQQSTSCQREDEWRYGDGGRRRWQMTMVADNDDTCDWAADCGGEGREQAVRDSRDSRVVMMTAAAADDNSKGRQQHWQMAMACEIGRRPMKGMDMSGRREMVETRSSDDGCRSGRWRRWTMIAADDDNGDGRRRQWRWRTMTAVNDDSGG